MKTSPRHVRWCLGYEQAAPAYRYGGELAGQEGVGDEWSTLEPEARRRWEERHPGTWERFRHG
jgi:hypothetical protein